MFLVFVLLCIFVPLVFSPSVFCTYCLWTVSVNKIEFFIFMSSLFAISTQRDGTVLEFAGEV